jgi:hypothetical protein
MQVRLRGRISGHRGQHFSGLVHGPPWPQASRLSRCLSNLKRDPKYQFPVNKEYVSGDRFYEYYLSLPIPLPPFRPANRILSGKLLKDRLELSNHLKENPLSFFEGDDPSLGLAAACLVTYFTISPTRHRFRQEVRERCFQHKPGSRAMEHLLRTNGYNGVDFLLHPEFGKAMCFALAAEGPSGEEILWDFISADYVPSYMGRAGKFGGHQQNANLCRYLVG